MPKFHLYDSKYEDGEDFTRNKRQKTYKLNDTFSSIPLHERSDQFDSSASAINSGLDFIPKFVSVDKPTRIDEDEFKFQVAAGNIAGARIVRHDEYKYKHNKKSIIKTASRRYHIDEDHFLNVQNESRFGLHGINQSARGMFKGQDANTVGSSNNTRYAGLERHKVPEFYPRLPESIPESMVETNTPNQDVFRFNDKTVETPPLVFPSAGF
jgi:hypothetical protein